MGKIKRGLMLAAILGSTVLIGNGQGDKPERLGFSWEISYDEGEVLTEQQFEMRREQSFISGSIVTATGSNTQYGLVASLPKNSESFGQYKSKSPTSYFNRASRSRSKGAFLGLRTDYFPNRENNLGSEIFGGANINGKIFLDANSETYGRNGSKIYTNFKGKTIGFAEERKIDGLGRGFYYISGDMSTHVESSKNDLVTRVQINDLMGKDKEIIFMESEKFDAEVEYSPGNRFGASLRYRVSQGLGLLKRFYLSIGAINHKNKTRTRIDNSISIGKENILNTNVSLEPEEGKYNLGLQIKY